MTEQQDNPINGTAQLSEQQIAYQQALQRFQSACDDFVKVTGAQVQRVGAVDGFKIFVNVNLVTADHHALVAELSQRGLIDVAAVKNAAAAILRDETARVQAELSKPQLVIANSSGRKQ